MLGLRKERGWTRVAFAGAVAGIAVMLPPGAGADRGGPFLSSLGSPALIASTVPTTGAAVGDQNPYGVAVVPRSVGSLVRNDVLVSNFNAVGNLQGTGSTVMQVDPDTGSASVFAQISPASVPGCTGGVGLTTALAVFRQGWVVVGSLPVTDAGAGSAAPGCLIVLDSEGNPVETITGPSADGSQLIDGPWDMTAIDHGHQATLFVTTVLGDINAATQSSPVPGGTVVRIGLDLSRHAAPTVTDMTVVANGISVRPDPNALVVGPTGVALEGGTLFIADSVNSQILAVPDALFRDDPAAGSVISAGGNLSDPLGMTIAPDGDLVTVNGNNGEAVETTPEGSQLATATLDDNAGGGGNLFGVTLTPDGRGLYFVDDFSTDNSLFVATRMRP